MNLYICIPPQAQTSSLSSWCRARITDYATSPAVGYHVPQAQFTTSCPCLSVCACVNLNNSFKTGLHPGNFVKFFACWQVTFDFQIFDLCNCGFINMWMWMWLSSGTQRYFFVNSSRDTASQAENYAWGRLTNLTSCLLSVCLSPRLRC